MKDRCLLSCALLVLAGLPRSSAQCYHFTQEHVDLLSVQWSAADNALSLMAADDDHGGTLYASNQCVVICPESMRFSLPAGTPLGDEGDPLWILPQSPYPGAPYVGVSAEARAPGSFRDPLTIALLRLEGPGDFLLWQAGSLGSFDVKMDTRDGIDARDRITPFVGGHEHYNWGFTTSGVYRAYFQARGVRPGQTTNTLSPETPFTFQVLPLRPFELWTATNWPCECATNLIAAGADPDGDQAANAFEYGTGTDPKLFTTNAWSELGFVLTNGQAYGALTFSWAKAATDAVGEVEASRELTAPHWQQLTNLHGRVDQGLTELVTIRDGVSASSSATRFYRLRVRLD